LRFSFFDRVLGISPQVVGCRLLSPIVRMVEFTISRFGQSYSLARLMSSRLPGLKLLDDIMARLAKPRLPSNDSDAEDSITAVEHGRLRRAQHYTSAMLIHESRILQVTIFGTLHQNLNILDFNLLLPDVMIIADEVDAQLTQTMESFTNSAPESAKPQPLRPKGVHPRSP
jgi:hypothetical protein